MLLLILFSRKALLFKYFQIEEEWFSDVFGFGFCPPSQLAFVSDSAIVGIDFRRKHAKKRSQKKELSIAVSLISSFLCATARIRLIQPRWDDTNIYYYQRRPKKWSVTQMLLIFWKLWPRLCFDSNFSKLTAVLSPAKYLQNQLRWVLFWTCLTRQNQFIIIGLTIHHTY